MVDICLSAIIPIKTLNLNLKLKYRSLHESHNPSPKNCSGYGNKRCNRKRYVSVIDWNLAAPICDLILEPLINFIFGFHYIAHKNFSETHSLCCSYPFYAHPNRIISKRSCPLHESHNPSPVNCSGYRNKRRNRKRYVSVIDWNLAAPICDLILEQLINFIFGFHYIAHKNFSETHSLCCSYPFSSIWWMFLQRRDLKVIS